MSAPVTRSRTALRSAGVCIHQLLQDGRWVDREVSIGDLRIPIIGVVNCTGRPMPEARQTAERLQALRNAREDAK